MVKKIKLFNYLSFWNKFRMTLALLFLTSCSLTWTVANPDWLTSYSWNWYSLSIPTTWKVETDIENILPKPSHGKVELSVSSKETKWWFSNNLLVLSSDLKQTVTSKDFSLWNIAWSDLDYIDYKKLEAKDITFDDKQAWYLHVFEWKYNQNTPRLRYLQTAHVCDKKVYFVTISLSLDTTDYTKYEKILNTLSCG
jgi:hypothetical protein